MPESGKSQKVIRVYNRPARVEKRLPTTSIVRWQDNGTQGFVPTETLEEVEDQ